jgi:transcriptional regulator of acetoin/glycerol metabolism
MIAQSRFREDLYYRLNGLVVKLPPLRERTDLSAVIRKMLDCAAAENGGGQALSIADDVMTLFGQCAWPGNFRQLGNLLRTAAVMVDADGEIRREHLPDDFFDDLRVAGPSSPHGVDVLSLPSGRLHDVAASVIANAVAQHGGNVSAAARTLGISRNTIYRKLPAHGANNSEDAA